MHSGWCPFCRRCLEGAGVKDVRFAGRRIQHIDGWRRRPRRRGRDRGSLFPLNDRIDRTLALLTYGDLDSRHLCTHAKLSDLPGLHALYTGYFGADVPAVDVMGSWVSRCNSSFTLVNKVVHDSGLAIRQELVGSFKVLPLTPKGVRAIELGQVSGSTFRSEHICGNRSLPAGYYVGDVVGKTRFARGVVMAHLNAVLSPATGVKATIYARPLTRDGLRVMKKHGFVQISDGKSAPEVGRVCKLQMESQRQASPGPATKRRRLAPVVQGQRDVENG